VCQWDFTSGEQLSCLNNGDTLWVTSLAIAPGDHHALSGGPRGDVILWDLDTGRAIRQFDAGSLIHDVAICPNGDYGLLASEAGAIHVWNLQAE
jgi:WD40 repeat protein